MITKEAFQTAYATLSQIFPSIKKDLESKQPAEQQAELQLRYLILNEELDNEDLESATRLMCIKCEKLFPGDNWTAKLIAYANPPVSEEWTDVVRAIRENISGADRRYNINAYHEKIINMKLQCPLAYIVATKLGLDYVADNISSDVCIAHIRSACEAEKSRAAALGVYIERYEEVRDNIRVGSVDSRLGIEPTIKLPEK